MGTFIELLHLLNSGPTLPLMLLILVLFFLLMSKRKRIQEVEASGRSERDKLESEKTKEILKREALEKRFKGVLDIEMEIERIKSSRFEYKKLIDDTRASYRQKKEIYDRLRRELAVYDERLAFAELGVYEPHFDFQDSESFKEAIREVKAQQKKMVSAKAAVISLTTWVVEGSEAKGRTMVNRNIRLALRAFNNECEAAIANTRWNNVNAMEKRMRNARLQIDKLNDSNQIAIEQAYVNLKLKELYLTHEYREKLKRERDERAEASRLAREEGKLIREAAAAQKKEDEYRTMLDKARKEAGLATSSEIDTANKRVAELEKQLEQAHERTERAQAMAEKTKSGYVYIVSNIGSFGEDVMKIGMTRRLEPYDRVRELGDASVPFVFDTHAMIYSEDAPSLEMSLHAEFEDRRVNAANYRKEFFRVTVDEVEEAVKRLAPDADFFRDIEAQEFHETIAKRHLEAEQKKGTEASEFPDEI